MTSEQMYKLVFSWQFKLNPNAVLETPLSAYMEYQIIFHSFKIIFCPEVQDTKTFSLNSVFVTTM